MLQTKKQRTGILIYSIVMTAVFLLCIALLLAVIIWNGSGSAGDGGTSDLSAIGTVAQTVKPSTVLINAYADSIESYGTGFFITETGYIATNYHIVSGANKVKITTYSGKQLDAEVVGWYAPDDLAVLKVEGNSFPAVVVGDSSKIRVGDLAIAIGNPSGAEAAWTTTHGIISALNRKVAVSDTFFSGEMTMLQTDAPVNPGNSGGPLCNSDGEVIGIVTRKLTDYEAIGFAIPINEAMVTLTAIMEGRVSEFDSKVSHARPAIGISGENITKGEQFRLGGTVYTAKSDGVLVVSIVSGGAAENVLEVGDILYAFDGRTVPTITDLQTHLYNYKPGDQVEIKIWRRGESLDLTLTFGK
ncbi:MAG: trypsin-like peptidase domain-containing protein [Clostridia bacterium]|nr:trypsin-like peptidase domain-containing protein [Clostridia bacterium]